MKETYLWLRYLGQKELSRPLFPTSLILSKAFLPSNFSGHCLNTSNDGKLTTSQGSCSIFRQLNALLGFLRKSWNLPHVVFHNGPGCLLRRLRYLCEEGFTTLHTLPRVSLCERSTVCWRGWEHRPWSHAHPSLCSGPTTSRGSSRGCVMTGQSAGL